MSWPLVRVNTQGDPNQSRYYADEKKDVDVEVTSVRSGGDDSQIIGSSEMFDENGNIRLIPVSSGFCSCQSLRLGMLFADRFFITYVDAHSESKG